MSQLFASGGQHTGASASVLPMNIQDSFPLGWTGLITLQSKGLSRVFSSITIQKHQFFGAQPFYGPTLTSIHDHWKHHSFDNMDLSQQMMSLFIISPEATVLAYSQQGGPSCCVSLLCPLERCISSAFVACL